MAGEKFRMYSDEDIENLINDDIDDLLEADEKAELNAFLNESPRWKDEYDKLSMMRAALLDIPDVELPQGFDERLHEALLKENIRMKSVKPKQRWRMYGSVAAIFAIGLFSYFVYNNMADGQLPGSTDIAMYEQELEQDKIDKNANDATIAPSEESQSELPDVAGVTEDKSEGSSKKTLDDRYGTMADENTSANKSNNETESSKTNQIKPAPASEPGKATDGSSNNVSSEQASNAGASAGAGATPEMSSGAPEASNSAGGSEDITLFSTKREGIITDGGNQDQEYYDKRIEEKLAGCKYEIVSVEEGSESTFVYKIKIISQNGKPVNKEIEIQAGHESGEELKIVGAESLGL